MADFLREMAEELWVAQVRQSRTESHEEMNPMILMIGQVQLLINREAGPFGL